MQYTRLTGTLLIKIAIISHGKSLIRFESTISLLKKFARDFLFFLIGSSRTTDSFFGGHLD